MIDKGYVYVVDGDVYFRIRKFVEYGKFFYKNIEELMVGVCVDLNEKKEDLFDFVLWKVKKEGELVWSLFWGEGWLGWYIECFVMVMKYFGEIIDIYVGG